MKKFISMVMAAAMVVSLVPATAFAAGESRVKVVDVVETTKALAEAEITGPELQIKIKEVDSKKSVKGETFDITLEFDNAEFMTDLAADAFVADAAVTRPEDADVKVGTVASDAVKKGDDSIDITVTEEGEFNLSEGDVITIPLANLVFSKTSVGTKATVDVSGDFGDYNDLVFATILDKGISVSSKKAPVDVAEEEIATLKDVKIEPSVGDDFSAVCKSGDDLTLKLSKGFEFANDKNNKVEIEYKMGGQVVKTWDGAVYDGNELVVENAFTTGAWAPENFDELVIKGMDVEATSAKSGAVCTMTVKLGSNDSVKLEVAKVVDYKVALSVDEDEDLPVIYSGVNVDNFGITDDSDHVSLEVTAEETFPGAWSFRKGFSFELPEGVYVTAVDVVETDGILRSDNDAKQETAQYVTEGQVEDEFFNAYQDGDHVNFEFSKRVFDDVDATLNDDEAKMVFTLTLVADPTFEGDVVLKLTGDLVDEQEVTIAKFVKPYTVKAEQNDLIIDYRYTDIPTAITITEAEAGLWEKDNAKFWFEVEKSGLIQFEDDATFEVDADSEMELKGKDTKDGRIEFTVKSESDEAATVTIKDMQLFMQRNIPAGPYDLSIGSSLAQAYEEQKLYAPDETGCTLNNHDDDKDCYVGDVCDYSDVVKEAFVNVVTAGRDKDDASFTTKVVVPVGEAYIIAGETQIALDVPAYINAAGYTMLPVRAVATALGILNNNVLWDQATKTVTILYGQRIITMVAGQKVVYVNGSAIPASASVEIVNGRTFLPMRDLATALGVTDITWDAATKTATLNGNQK